MEIRQTDDYLPEEEDRYGVNEINEYDFEYWMPAEARERRRRMLLRATAALLAVAFGAMALWLFR